METETVTWRQLISDHLYEHGETEDDIVFSTLSDEEMDRLFDSYRGWEKHNGFRAWTYNRVLFPVVYDGCECVASVLRNPDLDPDTDVDHIGGF